MKIVTLTVNPALDKTTTVEFIKPESKLRCESPTFEAGGGGINVSRALKKLGFESKAIYLSGGPIGMMMNDILAKENVLSDIIEIKDNTRENFTVVKTSTNEQFRFGMPGPTVVEAEWKESLAKIEALEDVEYLIASGSLAPGMPEDYYAQVAKIAKKKGIKVVLDTSGESLRLALEVGVHLIKPNINELRSFVGTDVLTDDDLRAAASEFIKSGKTDLMIVSLGEVGAKLFSIDETHHAIPPHRRKNSTVGAGDSMVAGTVLALSQNKPLNEVIKWGVACGTAATMNNGTGLCRMEDVEDLLQNITMH